MGCFLTQSMEEISDFITNLRNQKQRDYLGFCIGTTAHFGSNKSFYFTPIRHSRLVSYGGVIVKNVDTAKAIAENVDSYVDFTFVDSEKKIPITNFGEDDVGNLEKALMPIVSNSILLSYKGNDITQRTVDALIRTLYPNMSGSKVAIIGIGNLGAKIALSILEVGNSVYLYSTNQAHTEKISNFLNEVKTRTTLSLSFVASSISEAAKDAEVLVATSHRKRIVALDHVESMKVSAARGTPILIDVGKGCFANEIPRSGVTVYRVDVQDYLSSEFDNLISLRQRQYLPTRGKSLFGHTFVRKGIVGNPGDILVDHPENPQVLYGICGEDGVLRTHGEDLELMRRKLVAGLL